MRKAKNSKRSFHISNGGLFVAAILSTLIAPGAVNAQTSSANQPRAHSCAKGAPTGSICRTIVVPENHAKPAGKSIDLEVMILPATGAAKKAEPLIIVPDLGQQGTTVANDYAKLAVRKTNDIVLLDQRGTIPGKPNLACPSSTATDLANLFVVDPLEVELDRVSKEVKKCFDGYRSAGIDIDAYNSAEAANDLPFVVKALGVKKANFYGIGIGARVVLQGMRVHPGIINSAVLDSTEPATPDWFSPSQRLVTGNEGFEALYKACASQPGCAASRGDLKAKINTMREKLNKAPLTVPVTTADGKVSVQFNGNDATALILQLTLDGQTLPLAPSIIDTIAAGEVATLSQLFAQLLAPPPGAQLAGAAQDGLAFAQLCNDSAYSAPSAADKAAMATTSWTASSLALGASVQCRAANTKPLPASFRTPVTSSIPTLLLVGDMNPIGTPSLSRKVAETLNNATLVSFPDQSRGVLLPSQCAQKVVTSFISSPTKVDKSCVARLTGPKLL
jgi:pimeloyl-ACP methyl ester carboxylesterase